MKKSTTEVRLAVAGWIVYTILAVVIGLAWKTSCDEQRFVSKVLQERSGSPATGTPNSDQADNRTREATKGR